MKIKTTITEIECTANELKQSNSLSEGLYNMLRGVFNGMGSDCEDDTDSLRKRLIKFQQRKPRTEKCL